MLQSVPVVSFPTEGLTEHRCKCAKRGQKSIHVLCFRKIQRLAVRRRCFSFLHDTPAVLEPVNLSGRDGVFLLSLTVVVATTFSGSFSSDPQGVRALRLQSIRRFGYRIWQDATGFLLDRSFILRQRSCSKEVISRHNPPLFPGCETLNHTKHHLKKSGAFLSE